MLWRCICCAYANLAWKIKLHLLAMRHMINANYIFRQYCSFCWDVDIYKLLTCRCLAVSLGFLAGRQDMCPCCLSLFLTVLVETLTFVGQRLQRVLDVAYLCWRASRTSALSLRPVVACLLPELRRSFTSPGFSLCLLSILYTVLCNICIVCLTLWKISLENFCKNFFPGV